MKEESHIEYPEIDFVYDSLEEIYESSLSQGFELRRYCSIKFSADFNKNI